MGKKTRRPKSRGQSYDDSIQDDAVNKQPKIESKEPNNVHRKYSKRKRSLNHNNTNVDSSSSTQLLQSTWNSKHMEVHPSEPPRKKKEGQGKHQDDHHHYPNKPTKSLVSRLKNLRGTAESTPFPPEWNGGRTKRYQCLSPEDGDDFDSCLNTSYKGLYWEPPEKIPSMIHSLFSSAFAKLDEANMFQYDAVQPGRKRLSRTFVTRTLVGNPGSTYRYLGLRLFSHPWCDVDEKGDILHHECVVENQESMMGGKKGKKKNGMDLGPSITDGSTLTKLGYDKSTASALLMMGNLNTLLKVRSNEILHREVADRVPGKLVGSTEFSLTLINKMEPSSIKKDLKKDTIYGIGKASVNWHMDSGLQDFSTIAVYHELHDNKDPNRSSRQDKTVDEPWRVAVRISGKEGLHKTPPLSIPLPSGTVYYMLDDFNHKHEHAVLSGSNKLRYSSTHRVAREGRGTWQYIRDKCSEVLVGVPSNWNKFGTFSSTSNNKGVAISLSMKISLVKEVRKQQQLLTEIEFEWIRQWLIQGQIHANLHPYWHAPIETLKSYFSQLEFLSLEIISILKQSSKISTSSDTVVTEPLFDVMIEAFTERRKLRNEWEKRFNDPIFNSMDPSMQPMKCPILDRMKITDPAKQISPNLSQLIDDLRSWRTTFVQLGAHCEKGKRKGINIHSNQSRLTHKEQKHVSSNWQKMKQGMSRK